MICMGKNIFKWRYDMGWNGFFTGSETPWLFENVSDLNHPKKTDNCTWLPQIWPGLENASFSIRISQREWLCKQWDILTFSFFMLLLLQVFIVNTNHSLPIVSQKFECLLVLKVQCVVFNQVSCVCLTHLPLQSNMSHRCAPCDPRIWPRPGRRGVEAGDFGEFSGNVGRFPIKNWCVYVEHGKIDVFFSSKICPKLTIDCWPMKNWDLMIKILADLDLNVEIGDLFCWH